MNEKFLKYTYPTQEAWEVQKALISSTDEEVHEYYNDSVTAVVELGHIVITPAVIDDEGNIITPAVLSDDYCVDILWKGEAHKDFVPTWVTPCGVHGFGAKHAAEYAKAYCEANPEAEYCNPPEPEL